MSAKTIVIIICVVAILAVSFRAAVSLFTLNFVRHKLTRMNNQPKSASNYEGYHLSNIAQQYINPRQPGSLWFETQLTLMEDWFISSDDNLRLHAWFLPVTDAKCTAVICHGYTDDLGKIALYAKFLKENQIANCLIIDQRSHGFSDGNLVTLGIKESLDITHWIKEVQYRQGLEQKIIVIAWSMGAASVLLKANEYPHQVKALVIDSVFSSIYAESSRLGRNVFTRYIIKICTFFAFLTIKKRFGYNFFEGNVSKAVSRLTIPTLFFHGSEDKFVPLTMGEEVFNALASSDKEFVIASGSRHVRGIEEYPALYEAKLCDFINRILSQEEE